MGWTSASNWTSKKQVVDEITQDMQKNNWNIHAKASTSQGAYWSVTTKEGESFIYIAIFQKSKGEIYVKTFTETSGPYVTDCPLKLLDIPCTNPNAYSLAWREAVKAYHVSKSRDLTGKTVKLYGKIYEVLNKNKQGYSVIQTETGHRYKLTRGQVSQCEIIETVKTSA